VALTAYALLGPTASGKSKLALELAARRPIEIVSVDSALVYRGMDIGTAKPTPAERSRVPHHLIDIIDPDQAYSTGHWRREALHAVANIQQQNKTPLLVGGTMLYYRSLVSGLDLLPQADAALRKEIDAEAARRGWPALHAELEKVDPRAAQRISPNDSQRIQRALEVYRLTGETITSLQQQRVSVFDDVDVTEFAVAPLERRDLHTRIEMRFGAMLASGLLAEVRALFERGDLSMEHSSMRAVGYRQLWRHLAGWCGLSEAGIQAIAATRQLAKRQLTWLRRREQAQWFDSMHPQVARMMLDALSQGGFTASSDVTHRGVLC